MALGPLFNIPKSAQDFSVFSFHNQDMHLRIVRAIGMQMNVTLSIYPLDPMPMFDLAGWANIHQSAHSDFTGVLGITGNDFSSLNLNDAAELSAWIYLHANEHLQAANKLGLS